jgi:UPF0271 protein
LNVNSDLGEGAGQDVEILQVIDSANVCCGLHAGSATETLATVRRCSELGVEVGAHPGFDDRENFGRVEVDLPPSELEALVRFQVAAIAAAAKIAYIKPHGALYHYCQARPAAAGAVARVAADFGVGLMGQPGFALLAAAERLGVPAYREGFADRAYLADGRLAPRGQPGSVLEPEQAAAQALRLARSSGFDTICLHGDSPGAPVTARKIREAFTQAGVPTSPLAGSR